MGYGRNISRDSSHDMEIIKNKLREKMPEVDLDKINQQNVKDILMNEIDNNPNISQNVKDKINKGDMDGLKHELIKYLDSQNSSDESSKRIRDMLENNDYEGLQNELMSMLFKGITGQKKNEIENKAEKKAENSSKKMPFTGIFDEAFLNTVISKFNEENKNDSRIILLNSIKPFMSDGRQKVIDECIKTINLLAMMEKLGLKVGR